MGEVGDGDGVGEEGLADLNDGDVDDDEGGDSQYNDDYEDLPTFVAFVQAPRQGSRLSCTCDRIF